MESLDPAPSSSALPDPGPPTFAPGTVRIFDDDAGISYPYLGDGWYEWNLTGQPAISVPVGTSGDGLPIGMQLVGRHGEEATLLGVAAQLEAELRFADRRPPIG